MIEKEDKGGKIHRMRSVLSGHYYSKPYRTVFILLVFLLLFGPLLGLFQDLRQADTPDTCIKNARLLELSNGWEYRWARRLQQQSHENDPTDPAEWKPIAYPLNPPDRNGRNILLLRHSIPAGDCKEPALLIDGRGILLTFRAYVGEELIHQFGRMNALGEGHLSGISSHVIKLDQRHLGKIVRFHIFSDYSNIGIRGKVFLGNRSDLFQYVLKKDIARVVIGILLILIGILDFFGFRENVKTVGPIPMFGILALAMGFYVINISTLKDMIFSGPVFWFNTYIAAMSLIPVGAIGFIWQTFRPLPGNFLHRLWMLHVGFAVVIQLLFLLILYSLAPMTAGALMLNLLRLALILEMVMILGIIAKDAFIKKDSKARIYLLGFTPIILAGFHDSLVGLGKIATSFSYSPWAMLSFILSIELIRRRKFINVQARLKNYAERLEANAREKEDLLRDLHDGIGGLVTNIKFLSEMGRSSPSASGMQDTLKNISDLSSESLIEIGNFMQNLDEDDMNWSILVARFRHFGARLLESRGLNFRLKEDVAAVTREPDRMLFINLLQIYKEAITNATKHSGATAVEVTVSLNDRRLILSIQDDGIGFGKNIVRGKGLSNMKARAQKIGGTLSIKSDRGTLIVVKIPFSEDPFEN